MSWVRRSRLILLGMCILCIDQALKCAVYSHFTQHPFHKICCFYDWLGLSCFIEYVVNRGAAWGFLSSMQLPLLCVRISLIAVMLVYLFFFRCPQLRHIPLMMVIGGAIGNVCDFFVYGHVVDMFHFTLLRLSFPVFNIADTAIFCGLAKLFMQNFFFKNKRLSTARS